MSISFKGCTSVTVLRRYLWLSHATAHDPLLFSLSEEKHTFITWDIWPWKQVQISSYKNVAFLFPPFPPHTAHLHCCRMKNKAADLRVRVTFLSSLCVDPTPKLLLALGHRSGKVSNTACCDHVINRRCKWIRINPHCIWHLRWINRWRLW